MKKRLRFKLPHTPLKILRGEQDEEDLQDKYYERFQAPGTSTEEAEDDKVTDDDSIASSLSHDDITSDVSSLSRDDITSDATDLSRDDITSNAGEVSRKDIARCLGGSIDNVNDDHVHNASEYIGLETTDVQVVAQVHHEPDLDVMSNDSLSNDDTSPLLP